MGRVRGSLSRSLVRFGPSADQPFHGVVHVAYFVCARRRPDDSGLGSALGHHVSRAPERTTPSRVRAACAEADPGLHRRLVRRGCDRRGRVRRARLPRRRPRWRCAPGRGADASRGCADAVRQSRRRQGAPRAPTARRRRRSRPARDHGFRARSDRSAAPRPAAARGGADDGDGGFEHRASLARPSHRRQPGPADRHRRRLERRPGGGADTRPDARRRPPLARHPWRSASRGGRLLRRRSSRRRWPPEHCRGRRSTLDERRVARHRARDRRDSRQPRAPPDDGVVRPQEPRAWSSLPS